MDDDCGINVMGVETPWTSRRIEVKVRLGPMPESPDLFRLVEHPLGLAPFPLSQPALAVIGGFTLPSGWAFG